MKLNELQTGKSARIISVGGTGALRQHFLDMGMIPGTTVKTVKYAPMGDPVEVRINGYELTLRIADAAEIEITPVEEESENLTPQKKQEEKIRIPEHPGLGEGGKFHSKKDENPLPGSTEVSSHNRNDVLFSFAA